MLHEKVNHWRHCGAHSQTAECHVRRFVFSSLVNANRLKVPRKDRRATRAAVATHIVLQWGNNKFIMCSKYEILTFTLYSYMSDTPIDKSN